jgi:TolB protein
MKKISLLILAFAGVASSAAAQPRIAFERQPSVWIANIDGSGQRKIADGINPDLSPDGRFLAFNTVEPRQLHRLAIADLDSGRITILKEIPSEDCEQPNWSRDGRKLLFVFDAKTNERHVGIVNADGSGFRDVQAGLAYDIYYTPVWAADGQSFFCEENQRSGNYIYRVGLDGRVMRRWLEVSGNLIQQALPGGSLIPGGELSGWMPIHASPDGTSLLLNAEMSGAGRTRFTPRQRFGRWTSQRER